MRLQAIREAKVELDARAAVRTAAEQTAYEGKLKAREDKEKDTGQKPRGKPPTPPTAGPRATDQLNLTDPDSRVMPGPGGSFEQSYNAQAAVDTDTMLGVATPLTQAANDKRQISPMLHTLGHLPEELGTVTQILADAGYYSAANVEPLIAAGRESPHLPWKARFTEPAPLADGAAAVAQMKHRLKIRAGRAL